MALEDVFAVLAAGLLLGIRHATDSDHVVAVATIVSREKSLRGAARIGFAWGLGHTATLLLVGGAIIAFRVVVPERLALSLELVVAVMLVVLGAANLGAPSQAAAPSSTSGAPLAEHPHPHASGENGVRRPLRSFSVGLVHGLAGSAAIALLVLSTIHAPGWALAYLLLFSAGTVLAMTAFTCAMAVPMAAATRFRFSGLDLGRLSGMASIALGLVLAYRIGFVQHLLASLPV